MNPRIPPLDDGAMSPAMRAERDAHLAHHGKMTNMKRTLAHDPVAFHALMEWYPLRNALTPVVGERRVILFAHAISAGTDCLICSTFFRRILIDAGENPDALTLDAKDEAIIAFGRQLAKDPHGVDDAMFARLADFLEPATIVALTAFGGVMVATNLFNNALRVPLDEYLFPYRSAEPSPSSTG